VRAVANKSSAEGLPSQTREKVQAYGGKKLKVEVTPRKSESPKYQPHTGKVAGAYQKLGGLGPSVGDERWKQAAGRRKNMIRFSSNVNEVNRQVLGGRSEDSDEDASNMSVNPNVTALKERREKALEYAKSIKKPKANISSVEPLPEERFQEYDNNQYLLENQKIKMLFN